MRHTHLGLDFPREDLMEYGREELKGKSRMSMSSCTRKELLLESPQGVKRNEVKFLGVA